MKKTENTTNTSNTKNASTMNAVKRAKSIVVYDKHNNATLISVTNEDSENYKLANKKTVSRADALANISKNRYNSYVREDNTTYKSYHSHVDAFKDINALYEVVKSIFADATQTQYFVFCKDKSIKLRIQKNAVEIMCDKLENAETCTNSKDANKYKYFVTATTEEEVKAILNKLK
jgi:hypothetical protein